MVRFDKQFLFLKVSEVWFGYRVRLRDIIGLTAYFHIRGYEGKIYGVKKKSFTVENKIDLPDEDILAGFQKTVKTEIKQAEKLNINYFFEKDAVEFVRFYNDFAQARRISPVSERRMKEMGNSLEISFASFEGVPIVAHSYLVDRELGIARLLHSASKRLDEKFDKQLAGRANKLLHFKDMLHFRDSGISIYDFGGYAENTTDKGLQGINSFKLSFGGQKIECINYSSYLYFILKKIAGGLGLLGRE